MRVDVLGPEDTERYRSLLATMSGPKLYPSLEFRGFLRDAAGGSAFYLVARSGEQLLGVLPFFECQASTGDRVINSLPWYGSHGGCWLAGGVGPEVRVALLRRFATEVAERRPLTATLVLTPEEEAHRDVYEALLPVRARSTRIGQVTALPSDGPSLVDDLLSRFQQKTRNLVRKSVRQGFELDAAGSEASWRFLYATHVENMAAMGATPKPWEHFLALRRHLGPTCLRLYVARRDGEPVAALLLADYGGTVEYLTPVVRLAWRSEQPLSFVIFSAMIEAVRRGDREWNWGGTWHSQVSLHHFKHGWGAEDRPYTYLIVAPADPVPRVRELAGRLGSLFPWYYVYPYEELADLSRPEASP